MPRGELEPSIKTAQQGSGKAAQADSCSALVNHNDFDVQ
jgi:hypothetical protein